MKIVKTKINYQDERGVIRDMLTHTPIEALTFITFAPGAVRGNHYHEHTLQYDYILKGKLMIRSQKGKGGKVEEAEVSEGDLISFEQLERHAYKALEASEMISCAKGVRQGEDYEKDVIRLSDGEKLIS